jgi:hypothetical protein
VPVQIAGLERKLDDYERVYRRGKQRMAAISCVLDAMRHLCLHEWSQASEALSIALAELRAAELEDER